MGYMKHKYTRVYFLKKDADGNPTPYGAEGVEAFEKGGIRLIDEDILRRLEFLGKVVLDFGFGRGEAIKYALDKGATKAVGVDFSEAANAIAADFLRDYGTRVELYCEDASEFLKLYVLSRASEHFDIVLMLDFIEHVPRSELAELLKLLRSAMSQRGIVIINTPVFTVDNDVIKEGLKTKARDTSDHFEETAGMHCNRYTRRSLQRFLQRCGYQAISGHVFVSKTPKPLLQRGNPGPWRKALIQGYPVKAFAPDEPEVFEYVSPSDALPYYIKVLKKLRLLSTLSSAKELVVGLIGHLANVMNSGLIFRQGMGKDRNRSDEPALNNALVGQCVRIRGGPLKGYILFLNFGISAHWHQNMIEGNYETFLFEELLKLGDKIRGKVIWDVGAHIGYCALGFAALGGDSGHVVAFEPNNYNAERLRKNLEANPDLERRITLMICALSNVDGNKLLLSSDEVDSGRSSGSHLSDVISPEIPAAYKGFSEVSVSVCKADTLVSQELIPIPSVIKIDVEGAEYSVLEGARDLLSTHKPLLLLEIHNITMMFRVQKLLSSLNYDLEILDEEHSSLSRCFIMARPKNW